MWVSVTQINDPLLSWLIPSLQPSSCIVRKLDFTTSVVSTVIGTYMNCGQALNPTPALQARYSIISHAT